MTILAFVQVPTMFHGGNYEEVYYGWKKIQFFFHHFAVLGIMCFSLQLTSSTSKWYLEEETLTQFTSSSVVLNNVICDYIPMWEN